MQSMPAIPKMPAGTGSASGSQFPTETEINSFFNHPCWEVLRNQCWGKGESSGFSVSDFQESFLRFHREPKIDKSQAFKMHILMDFMMGVEKADACFDRQQVLDLSLVKEQGGQLKLLLFSNIDSPLLSKLCGIISDQYGIPVEYPQLDPKNYYLNNKNESISVDSKRKLPGEASVKTLSKDEQALLCNRFLEARRKDKPDYIAFHAEQRAQQYINANSNLNLVHHANTQTSFCDDNVLMRLTDTIPVLKSRPQDCELSKDLSDLVDRLIRKRLNFDGKNSDTINGKEVVRQIVNSFFNNGSDVDVDVLNKTIQNAEFQRNSFFSASNVEGIFGQYWRRQAQKTNGEINFDELKTEILTLLEKWKRRLGEVSLEQITNDQLLQQNLRDKARGSCQCCRIALRSGKGSAGSFIQDIPGEIPVKFAEPNGVFKLVVDKMEQKEFLEREQSEGKTYVFTKKYADRALNAEFRESFIGSLATDLDVPPQELTNFFGLLIFTHLKGTLVPWPLPKGRQSRTLPLDFDKIINTAILDEKKDQLDLKALLDKKGDLNQTGDLTILDTRDAEREGVSKMLASRLGASLLNEGESDGNNVVQLKYVLNYGAESSSTYKLILQYEPDGKLGISKIERVGARDSLETVFPAV